MKWKNKNHKKYSTNTSNFHKLYENKVNAFLSYPLNNISSFSKRFAMNSVNDFLKWFKLIHDSSHLFELHYTFCILVLACADSEDDTF